MNNKKILIFGAAGFIGTYLIDELLKNEYDITASDINGIGEKYYKKRKVDYVNIDILNLQDFDKLDNRNFDCVIHLAALQPATFDKKQHSPKNYLDVNVNGTVNILEYCRKNSVKKIIYGSSHRNTSGFWKNNIPIKEEDGKNLEYEGEYAMFGISESAAQDCVMYYGTNYDMDAIIFRLPPVYGYGPHLDIFKNGVPIKTGFQTFIDNAKLGKTIEVWGNTSVGRDIIYVKDVVRAFISVINRDKIQGLYNITSNYKLTLQEEVETILNIFCDETNKSQLNYRPEKQHTMDSFIYDNSKALNDFGWSPKYSFEGMLLDYELEMKSNKFKYLIEKREEMFHFKK